MTDTAGSELHVLEGLARTWQRHWRGIASTALISAVAAATAVLLLPERYRSYGQLIPDMSGPTSMGGLGTLASLAGRIGLSATPVGLTPDYYASLLENRAALEELAKSRVDSAGVLADVGRPMAEILRVRKRDSLRRLEKTIEALERRIDVHVDPKTGIITSSIDLASPQMAQEALAFLFERVVSLDLDVRQARARAERAYLEGRKTLAHDSLVAIEERLRAFYEGNRTWEESPMLRLRQTQMIRELDLAREAYSQIALNLETAMLEEKRTTPGVLVLLSPTLAAEHSYPRRRMTVVLVLAGSLVLAWTVFFVGDYGGLGR